MSDNSKDIVINLDFRRLLAVSILATLTLVTVYTYIGALLAFDAPSFDLPLRTSDIDTLDVYDTPNPASFARGTLIDFRIFVEAGERYLPYLDFFAGNVTYRCIVTLYDSNDVPMLCKSTVNSILANDAYYLYLNADMMGSDYLIPTGSPTGTWTLKVVFWTDWLLSGTTMAPLSYSQTFLVT